MTRNRTRWRILALLFLVRTAMGFQFQTVGALSPLFVGDYGLSLADVGLLIGLYLAPGAVFAIPGGALGARFGDKRVVLCGLALMAAGGVLSMVASGFEAQVAARLLAGTGGVILNVLMSKMVADWFAGREIATAMGVFVNSWPVGIGLGLVALPAIAAGGGLIAALGAATGLVVLGFALLAAFYRDPAAASGPAVVAAWPRGAALRALSAAAGVWALYNAALAMVFGFGPLILVQRGLSLAQSGAVTSLMMWTAALSIPLGGLLADRTGRRDLVITVGLLGNAAGLLAAQTAAPPAVVFAVMGLVGGLPAGAIMSLPAAALGPAVRAAGMGLFFTLYYLVMLLAPPLVGGLAERLGGPSVAFDAGAVMLAAACALLLAYRAAMARLLMP